MSVRGNYTLSFYEYDRKYGGPEEGGWWYDTGRFERILITVREEERAYKLARRANRLLEYLQRKKRSLGSVLYNGGRYGVQVHEGLPPAHFPETRPHYE